MSAGPGGSKCTKAQLYRPKNRPQRTLRPIQTTYEAEGIVNAMGSPPGHGQTGGTVPVAGRPLAAA